MSDETKRKIGRPETTLKSKLDLCHSVSDTGCWIWSAGKDKDGYGITSLKRKPMKAHRASWVVNHGPIPQGMCVCHICDVPSCINPNHLFLGSARQNNEDRHAKGRDASMGRAGPSRFCRDEVIQMRSRHSSGESYSGLGRYFKTSANTIRRIVLGITWANLKEGIKS